MNLIGQSVLNAIRRSISTDRVRQCIIPCHAARDDNYCQVKVPWQGKVYMYNCEFHILSPPNDLWRKRFHSLLLRVEMNMLHVCVNVIHVPTVQFHISMSKAFWP